MTWTTRVSIVLLLAACTANPDGDPDTDPTVTDTTQDSDTDPQDSDNPDSVQVEMSGTIQCTDPSLRDETPWDRVAAQQPTLADPQSFTIIGGGIATADFDGDEDLDVFIPGPVDAQLHMQQPDGTFDREEDSRLLAIDMSGATGASVVDFDADGDLDIFVTRWREPNLMLANDGTGHFFNVTVTTGITGAYRSQTSSWGDKDGDGDLDLFVGNYGPRPKEGLATTNFEVADPSRLWENQGDGTFIETSDVFPQDVHDAYTFMSSWYDLDIDGDLDLLIVNDFGWARPSRVFWNTPNGLEMDPGGALGAGIDLPFAGMGLGIADLNNDERPDFLQTSWKEISLLVSRPEGFWVEESGSRNIHVTYSDGPRQIFGWGAELVDIDNDGDHDGVANFGYWETYAEVFEQRDALYIQEDGVFTEQAQAWGMDDAGYNRGLITADVNNDGMIDVIKRDLNGTSPMYLSRCNEAAWLRVRPRMDGPNTHAVGARIRFVSGTKVWTRTVVAGGTSMYSGGPPEVHVGLGDRDTLDLVQILWPDGEVTDITDVGTRQIIDVRRGSSAR